MIATHAGIFAEVNARLLVSAPQLLAAWLPGGRLRGHEWVCGDLSGKPGDSLSVNINTGKWGDFATDAKGGDLVSLYAAIKNLSQTEAARELGADPFTSNGNGTNGNGARQKRPALIPVPAGVKPYHCAHYKHGEPSQVWTYLSATRELLGHVARYPITLPDGKPDKTYRPWTHDGVQWNPETWQAPRPLYGQELLAERPDDPALVVEGERACDAGRTIVTARVVVTWPGGCKAWKKADWKPLHGRKVLLWPDADQVGIDTMWALGHYLRKFCPEVRIIIPDIKDGWDAADAVAEGWTIEKVQEWAAGRHKEITAADVEKADAPRSEPAAAATTAQRSDTTAPGASAVGFIRAKVINWKKWGIDVNGAGSPQPNLNNAMRVLERDDDLKGLVWYDTFLNRLLTGNPPREWEDCDEIELQLYLQREIGITRIGLDTVRQAALLIAKQDKRNCVQDYLNGLTWDGEPRIAHFFEDHFGAPANEYTRAAASNFWKSIAKRIEEPGCKVDNMVVLEGDQGIRKSTAVEVIGAPWYCSQHESATNKKAFAEVLQGKLIVEISEMDAFSKAEISSVKQVITEPKDRYREAYGRHAKDRPRQCVLVGTTNKNDYLRDETGGRRFWPIVCKGTIDIAGIRANRDQLFAEAVARVRAGETWWEMPEEETLAEQEKRRDADVWESTIAEFVELKPSVTVEEVLTDCLQIEVGKIGLPEQKRVGVALRALGWEKRKKRIGNQVLRVWYPKTEDVALGGA